jgi:hypothetical protein
LSSKKRKKKKKTSLFCAIYNSRAPTHLSNPNSLHRAGDNNVDKGGLDGEKLLEKGV